MRHISLEAAWLDNADSRNAEVLNLLPGAEVSAGVVTVNAGPGVEGEEIPITIISAVVPDADAPALRAALESYMLAHSDQAIYLCVRSMAHGSD